MHDTLEILKSYSVFLWLWISKYQPINFNRIFYNSLILFILRFIWKKMSCLWKCRMAEGSMKQFWSNGLLCTHIFKTTISSCLIMFGQVKSLKRVGRLFRLFFTTQTDDSSTIAIVSFISHVFMFQNIKF